VANNVDVEATQVSSLFQVDLQSKASQPRKAKASEHAKTMLTTSKQNKSYPYPYATYHVWGWCIGGLILIEFKFYGL
jgi:hypothetical protein